LKGKVVSYDSVKGVGKIISKEEGIKPFNINDWKDYKTMPFIGMEISFEIDNLKITNITPLNSNLNLNSLKEHINYAIPYNLRIRENISLSECLNDFFKKYNRIAYKHQDMLLSKKTLPYKKIKRFLFTAYNNLLEIDMYINDRTLLLVREALEEIERYYQSILGEIKNPIEIMLEKIFLNKQQNYRKIKHKFETNKSLISESVSKSKSLDSQIKSLTIKLNEIKNKKSDEYLIKETELKSYRKLYVDLIDSAQNAKDENGILFEDLKKFKEFYKKLFQEGFNAKIEILLQILLKELNSMTYKFDTILWENAVNSQLIQHFFKEAKIEGSYSTKTFIKYYLKNLNNEKMHSKDAELLEVFNELQVFNKSIVIYSKHRNQAKELAVMIENLDHDIDVKIFISFKEFILNIKDSDGSLDIVMLELDNENEDVVKKVIPLLERTGIKVILFSNKIKRKGIVLFDEFPKKLKTLI